MCENNLVGLIAGVKRVDKRRTDNAKYDGAKMDAKEQVEVNEALIF